MSENSSLFHTKKGLIALQVSPIDLPLGAESASTEDLSEYDFSDNSDKNWGLATKFYVLSTIDTHNGDSSAHGNLFSSILARFEDIVTSSGSFCFNRVRDEYGNYVDANGMISYNNGSDIGYVVLSKKRNTSFDELSSYMRQVEQVTNAELAKRQNELIAGDHIHLTYDASTNKTRISADNTEYVLPTADSTTLGGVKLDSQLKSDGQNPVKGSAIWAALEQKQNKLSGSEGIDVSDDGVVSVRFGGVAEGETRAVDGTTVYNELAKKQDNLTFDSTHFSVSSNSVNLRFGPIANGSTDIVSGGDIYSELQKKQNCIAEGTGISLTQNEDGSYTMAATGATKAIVDSGIPGSVYLTSSISVEASELVPTVGAIADKLSEKQNNLYFSTQFLTSVNAEGGVDVGMNFGHIEENSDKVVSGGELFTKINEKQDKLYFSTTDFTTSDAKVIGINYAESITVDANTPVRGSVIKTELDKKQNNLFFTESQFVTSEDGNVSLLYGTISEGSVGVVKASDAKTELDKKQNNLTFGSGFVSSDNTVTMDFADVTAGTQNKPVMASDVKNELSKKQNNLTFSSEFLTSDNNIRIKFGTVSETDKLPASNVDVADVLSRRSVYSFSTDDFNVSESEHVCSISVKYSPIASTNSGVASAGAIYDALAEKKNDFEWNENHFTESGITVSVDFGTIGENVDKAVSCKSAYEALTAKQDNLNFSTSDFVTSDGPIRINFKSLADTVNGAVSNHTVSSALSLKQDNLFFSSEFTTSNNVVKLNYGDISSGSTLPVSAGELWSKLQEKQNNLFFSSEFATSDSNVSLNYVGISTEGVTGVVKASDIAAELNKKQKLLTANDSDNIIIYTDAETGTLHISARDTKADFATADVSGCVYFAPEITESGVHTVPASTIYAAVNTKMDKFTVYPVSGLEFTEQDGVSSLGLAYATFGEDEDIYKPVRYGDAKTAIDALRLTAEGDAVTVTYDDVAKTATVSARDTTYEHATKDTYGLVKYSAGSLDENGAYTVPASTIFNSISAAVNAWTGGTGIKIEKEAGTEGPSYFKPNVNKISIDYGTISINNDKPVGGGSIWYALSNKQDKLTFSSTYFGTVCSITIATCSTIEQGSERIPTAGAVYDFFQLSGNASYKYYEIPSSEKTANSISLKNRMMNCLLDVPSMNGASVSVSFPEVSSNFMRDFMLFRTIPGSSTSGTAGNLVFPTTETVDGTEYQIEYYTTGENPFSSISLCSEGVSSTYQYFVSEVSRRKFLVSRKQLTAVVDS